MLPSIRTHAQYQSFVLEQLRTHYSGGVLMLVAKDWTLIEKFWLVDLSGTASVLSRQYATRGIQATDPADLLPRLSIFQSNFGLVFRILTPRTRILPGSNRRFLRL